MAGPPGGPSSGVLRQEVEEGEESPEGAGSGWRLPLCSALDFRFSVSQIRRQQYWLVAFIRGIKRRVKVFEEVLQRGGPGRQLSRG